MKEQNREFMKLKEEYKSRKMSKEQEAALRERLEQAKREKRRAKRRAAVKGWGAAAACVAVLAALPNTSMGMAHAMSRIPLLGRLVQVVTLRDYNYEDGRNSAQIQVPELVLGAEEAAAAQQELARTTEEINAQIREITGRMINEFEDNLKMKEGYQDIMVTSETLASTEDYFTLKLICYQGSGSGAQWNYFYTVDLNTGKRLKLADLFEEGADYITPISEEIKSQMRERMAEDEMQKYWLDDPDVAFWEFTGITDGTSFYLNENNEIVISFNEGDVAPMYMGCVEFVIPAEAVENIRRL